MPTAGLYVHIPFCRSKCRYCDFCSYPGLDALWRDYLAAVALEAAQAGHTLPWERMTFDTVFIGGGTPTLLPAEGLAALLANLRRALPILPAAEISIEANPGTVERAGLAVLRAVGYNRLSLGVQSLDDGELALLGRTHTAGEARAALAAAREAGFDNVNLDLIFGLPGQTLASWRATLAGALALAPEHLSLYALTVEEGTPLAADIAAGRLPTPDDDLAADMYEHAEAALAANYAHYEISNWARRTPGDPEFGPPRLACRHNLVYWHNERYLGLGAAAHGYDGRHRMANTADVAEYVAHMGARQSALAESEATDRAREMGETMMLTLRLAEGMAWAEFAGRFGVELRAVYGQTIDELAEDGLLQADERGIRLTPRGRLLGNRVFGAFLP